MCSLKGFMTELCTMSNNERCYKLPPVIIFVRLQRSHNHHHPPSLRSQTPQSWGCKAHKHLHLSMGFWKRGNHDFSSPTLSNLSIYQQPFHCGCRCSGAANSNLYLFIYLQFPNSSFTQIREITATDSVLSVALTQSGKPSSCSQWSGLQEAGFGSLCLFVKERSSAYAQRFSLMLWQHIVFCSWLGSLAKLMVNKKRLTANVK